MIIELFGLPGSGKSTLARAFESEGAVRIRSFSKSQLLFENLLFCFRYPSRTFFLFFALRYAPRGLRYYSFVNLFLLHNAKWMRARRLSKGGAVVVLDQGHTQNLLSLFAAVPPEGILNRYVRTLSYPDLLLVCEPGKQVRQERLLSRGKVPRSEISDTEARRLEMVSEEVFPKAFALLRLRGVRCEKVGEETVSLKDITGRIFSYVTSARMPTEKAHGISIAHMCASFAKLGEHVELVHPRRKNAITESVYTYYGIPKSFEVRRIAAPDFIGRGWTFPYFFFLQRLCFLYVLCRVGIPVGTLYTREPEIAWFFSGSHRIVYEAHDWPQGIKGRIVAFMVRNTALVVCNSRGTEAAARANGLTHVLVAPNGYDPVQCEDSEDRHTARARLGIPENAQVALYVGALDERKGIQTLLDASTLLPNGVMTVIGGSEDQIRKLSPWYPRIRFLGARPYKELGSNLSAANVLVLPNSAGTLESSSFTSPIKLFSYMASGVPIVATRVPAITAILNETNAVLVSPDNPRALVAGIQDILQNKQKGDLIGAQAKKDAKLYTWEARAEHIREILTK